jgi:uncharacterized protein (TIGR03435 family)
MTTWTDVIGWTLLHFVWEGALIAAVTAAALFACRRASAQLRYVIACAGLFTALAAVAGTPIALLGGDGFAPATSVPAAAGLRGSVAGATPAAHPRAAGPAAARQLRFDGARIDTALSAFVACWTIGVLLLTVRLGIGWWRVRRLHAEALTAPASSWLAAAQRIAARLDLSGVIHVVDSLHVDTPTVIGWLRPVVLLPIAAIANLTPEQVEAILAHELAHVRRHDFVVNLLQTIAETLLFYHPAVWWLSSRMRAEREHCCDDIAVEVCGDPVGYAEALTSLASWARLRAGDASARQAASAPLALAATGGSLLHRVRRLLRLTPDTERRRPKAPFILAATALLIVIAGARLLLLAQAPPPLDDPRLERHLGPADVNRILGFNLFPGPARYATDDPRGARAWHVTVAYPGGEMSFMGFTGRGLIRYAHALDGDVAVLAPAWLDTESFTIRAETSTLNPEDHDLRDAIRVALEAQFGLAVHQEQRLFPVYGLRVITPGALGPNLRPATADCIEDYRSRPDVMGPSLHERGQVDIPLCGVDETIRGPKGYRVTLAEFARSLRGFGMGFVADGVPEPEVVDQTGLTAVYDFQLNLGFLPAAAILTAHPSLDFGFGPMVRTFPQAIEEQLGLRLVPSEAPREVAIVATAIRAQQ